MIYDFDNGRIYHNPLGEDKFHQTTLDMKLMLKIKRQRHSKSLQHEAPLKILDGFQDNIRDEFIFRTVTVKTESYVTVMNILLAIFIADQQIDRQKKCLKFASFHPEVSMKKLKFQSAKKQENENEKKVLSIRLSRFWFFL